MMWGRGWHAPNGAFSTLSSGTSLEIRALREEKLSIARRGANVLIVDLSIKRAVITPIYEDQEVSALLFRELARTLGSDIFILAVDDGSVRHLPEPAAISAAGLNGVVIRLKRNVGHQRAIAVGINFAAKFLPMATCIIMDSDGEDLPTTVPQLLEPLGSHNLDVVVAQRGNRHETLRFKLFYQIYKLLFKVMAGRAISFGNFMALKPAAVRKLASMNELGIHVASCVLISKLRVKLVPIDRGPRYAGNSKMHFAGLILHGFQAFMVFAEHVLVRVVIACSAIAVLAVLGMALSLVLKAIGMATPGWASTALGILILVLLQTGILTLMTLMLASITRSNNLLANDYLGLIDEAVPVRSPNALAG